MQQDKNKCLLLLLFALAIFFTSSRVYFFKAAAYLVLLGFGSISLLSLARAGVAAELNHGRKTNKISDGKQPTEKMGTDLLT